MKNRLSALALALAWTLAHGQAARAQAPPGPNLNAVVHQLAERVRHLQEDIASDMEQTAVGRHLAQDAQELAQAVDELHETIHDNRDPNQVNQAYAGIDGAWQHLRAQFGRGASPAVVRAAAQVERLNAQLRQALGANAPPAGFYNAEQAPTGVADTQRLAHTLVQRAQSLAVILRSDLRFDPNGPAVVRDADDLARAADAFHDAIDRNQPLDVAARAFAPVDALADRIERYIASIPPSPRVQAAWQGFAYVEILIHKNLGLDSNQPQVPIAIAPPQPGGQAPIVGISGQLTTQVAEFIQVFTATSVNVPEGGLMLVDAQRLQAAAANFQRDAARNLPPNQLAFAFRDVDATWQRLARRVNRVARGRFGPNIQQVQRIGETCDQLRRLLAMPGYSPVFPN